MATRLGNKPPGWWVIPTMRLVVSLSALTMIACGGEVIVEGHTGTNSGLPAPVTDPPCRCPPGVDLASNGEGQGFCVVEPPDVPGGAKAACEDLQSGVFGFEWWLDAAPDYVCPTGAERFVDDDAGFCLWNLEEPPSSVAPYCLYFEEEGYLGYSWDQCAPGFDHVELDGTVECRLVVESLPVDAEPQCDDFDTDGLGFRWPLASDPDYTCPAGAIPADDGSGWKACLWEPVDAPSHAVARCAADASFIAYDWEAGSC